MSMVNTQTIINGATAAAVSSNFKADRKGGRRTFHAYGATSAGSGAATILIEVSDFTSPGTATNAQNWVLASTITLTLGTTRSGDGAAVDASWRWIRARVSSISGTDATVSVLMGA